MTIMELESQDSPALATKAAHRDGYNFHPKRYQYISIPAHALEFFLPPPPPQIKTRKKKRNRHHVQTKLRLLSRRLALSGSLLWHQVLALWPWLYLHLPSSSFPRR